MNRLTLNDLEQRIRERATAGAEESYTRTLLDRGVAHCARKLGEESLETVLAAVAEDRARLVAESADLLYHLLVLLHARGIALSEVEAELWQRRGKSRPGPKANSSPS
jgi:phosphoribosyl-ATP pyrophosphohydrolase